MLRHDRVPTRHFRNDCSGRVRFREDPALVLVTPAAPPSHPDANIDAAASIRSVNYMVNHICEPISSKSVRILPLSSPGARWGQRTAYSLEHLGCWSCLVTCRTRRVTSQEGGYPKHYMRPLVNIG